MSGSTAARPRAAPRIVLIAGAIAAVVVLVVALAYPAALGLARPQARWGTTVGQVSIAFVGPNSGGLATNFSCPQCGETIPFDAAAPVTIQVSVRDGATCAHGYHEIDGVTGTSLGGLSVSQASGIYQGVGGVPFPMQVPFCGASSGAPYPAELEFLLQAVDAGPSAQSEMVIISVS